MKKLRFAVAALAACSLASPALAADVITANSSPTGGWQYGTGNNYTPSNSLVLNAGSGDQLALRLHQPGQQASASDANGVYSFALGTPSISFDFDIGALNHAVDTSTALITLTNLLTGQTSSFNPFLLPDNYLFAPLGNGTAAWQNSERFTFGFLSGLGYNPNVNDTYSVNLTATFGNGNSPTSLTSYAQVGGGYLAAAVPEPATWAMMLVGFGAIGFSMRRQRKTRVLAQVA